MPRPFSTDTNQVRKSIGFFLLKIFTSLYPKDVINKSHFKIEHEREHIQLIATKIVCSAQFVI